MSVGRLQIVGVTCLPIAGSLLNGFFYPPLYRLHPALFWFADLTLFVTVPAAIVYWLAKSANIHPSNYGLQFPPRGGLEQLGRTLFFAVLLLATHFAAQRLGWVFTWWWYSAPDVSSGTVASYGVLRIPYVLYSAVSAGLMESIFYIALPWYFWCNYLGLAHRRRFFLCISSAVFAAVHWEQGLHNTIAAFAFGFVAVLLYWKVNDLWPIVGAHTAVDIVLIS